MGGHGKIIPFKDYKEAAEALMERNFPEILHDRQTKVIFIPETHLPKMPHIVDLEEFKAKKAGLTEDELALSGVRGGTEDIANASGDLVEKELSDALKEFYARPGADTKVVVLQGCTLRALKRGKWGIQENDFVIVDFERKAIICIEAKATLIGEAGPKAVEQTLELKSLLEKYFASELTVGEWVFVGMIYTKEIKTNQPCPSCSPFVILGPSELQTKLSNNLKHMGKQSSPKHTQFVSLLQILVFVVLQQRISTHCTIAGDVHEKVVGKNKDKPTGQGDFKSIIFWTKQQADIMLALLQFIFFISPWSTGKTICMREKAVMWATQNPTKKLFFVVVRNEYTKLTSLLEMELKDFFHQQHNLKNVEVLGLPSEPKDTLKSLLKMMKTSVKIRIPFTSRRFKLPFTSRATKGCLMVDVLVIPGASDNKKEMKRLHEQFTKELEQLQNHLEAQPAKP